jgi:hypothetical protein
MKKNAALLLLPDNEITICKMKINLAQIAPTLTVTINN